MQQGKGVGIMNRVASWMDSQKEPAPKPVDDIPNPNKEKAIKLKNKLNQTQSQYWDEKWNNLKEGLSGR